MSFGVVVIGRNEGERLRTCLESIKEAADHVVYVDSGSTDGSIALARGMGLGVVELDLSEPFTAARARNEGLRELLKLEPGLVYVQYVDGDCEIVGGWLETAAAFLDKHDDVAMVCGRLRERYPEKSIYNLLCDMEWDIPVGASKACGGIVMARVRALAVAGGYRTDLIAGEEPELCVRLRAAGWKIWRLDAEMAQHDAAITHFGQWWKRAVRAGYAFAHGAYLHGAPPERHWVRESRSAWIWGGIIPLITLVVVSGWGAWGFMLLAIFPLQVLRLALCGERTNRENWWRAFFLVLAKFPEVLGNMCFLYNRLVGKTARLIEYK